MQIIVYRQAERNLYILSWWLPPRQFAGMAIRVSILPVNWPPAETGSDWPMARATDCPLDQDYQKISFSWTWKKYRKLPFFSNERKNRYFTVNNPDLRCYSTPDGASKLRQLKSWQYIILVKNLMKSAFTALLKINVQVFPTTRSTRSTRIQCI